MTSSQWGQLQSEKLKSGEKTVLTEALQVQPVDVSHVMAFIYFSEEWKSTYH